MGVERAEEEAAAVDGDTGAVSAGGFDAVNAFVFGGGFHQGFSGVLGILGVSGEAEI